MNMLVISDETDTITYQMYKIYLPTSDSYDNKTTSYMKTM